MKVQTEHSGTITFRPEDCYFNYKLLVQIINHNNKTSLERNKNMNKRQRKKWLKKHGKYVNPKETWDLSYTIAEFIIPRLKYFKEKSCCYPGTGEMNTPEKWDAALDKMIHAFELTLMTDDYYGVWDINTQPYKEAKHLIDQKQAEVDEGLQLFGKWFQALWW